MVIGDDQAKADIYTHLLPSAWSTQSRYKASPPWIGRRNSLSLEIP